MREIRPYGSEGGAARKGRLYPYPGIATANNHIAATTNDTVTLLGNTTLHVLHVFLVF